MFSVFWKQLKKALFNLFLDQIIIISIPCRVARKRCGAHRPAPVKHYFLRLKLETVSRVGITRQICAYADVAVLRVLQESLLKLDNIAKKKAFVLNEGGVDVFSKVIPIEFTISRSSNSCKSLIIIFGNNKFHIEFSIMVLVSYTNVPYPLGTYFRTFVWYPHYFDSVRQI